MNTTSQVVQTLTEWLDAVNLETAAARVQQIVDSHYGVCLREGGGDSSPAHWHEAAHAVTGHALGRSIRCVYVRDTGGACEFEGHSTGLNRAVSLLAGPASELLLHEVRVTRKISLAQSFDLLAARLAIDEAHGLSTRSAAMLAVATVYAHWTAIERVASVLQHDGYIHGGNVPALCGVPQ